MTRDRKRPPLAAWIIGVIVFILAMGITFSNVYGLDRFEYTHSGHGSGLGEMSPPGPSFAPTGPFWFSENMGGYCSYEPPMPAVPEPITIWLVAIGGGLLLAGRRK